MRGAAKLSGFGNQTVVLNVHSNHAVSQHTGE